MTDFTTFFKLGFTHITDINGFDHILFLVALCAIYLVGNWREILVLVTAFTVGHSVTLALSTLNIVKINSDWIEFLIPITIMVTCVYNFTYKFKREMFKAIQKPKWIRYNMAVAFGLIHGLGFSNYLKSLLGGSSSIFVELMSFNIGLEVGQVLIVLLFMLLSYLVMSVLGLGRNRWNLLISGIAFGMSFMMAYEKWGVL